MLASPSQNLLVLQLLITSTNLYYMCIPLTKNVYFNQGDIFMFPDLTKPLTAAFSWTL